VLAGLANPLVDAAEDLAIQLQIDSLDPLVLSVCDIQATVPFYARVLGIGRTINVHQRGKEVAPKAFPPTPGAADLCFLTSISHGGSMGLSCGVPGGCDRGAYAALGGEWANGFGVFS